MLASRPDPTGRSGRSVRPARPTGRPDWNGRLDHAHAGVNPPRRVRRGRGRLRASRSAGALAAAAAVVASLLVAGVAGAADLLVGAAPDGDGAMLEFRLDAEDRSDIVGGRIVLGGSEYEISRVSRLGLIGARRFVAGDGGGRRPYAEFLVVASSFSEQTAVGTPWVAARAAYGCDKPYNTYAGVYRVEGEAAVKALGPVPYPDLVEDLSLSQRSHVTCFMARPPG